MSIASIISKLTNEGLAFEIGTSPYRNPKIAHSFYAVVSTDYYTLHYGSAQDNGRSYSNTDNVDFEHMLNDAYNEYRSRNPK